MSSHIKDKEPGSEIPVWMIRSGKNLTLGARATYMLLASYADERGRVSNTNQQTLAEDLGVSTRSTYSYLKELENYQAISIQRVYSSKTGNFLHNIYNL